MSYNVVWQPNAEQDLAQVYDDADDQVEVIRAAQKVDTSLRDDPLSQGVPDAWHSRTMVESPLVVQFVVNEADKRVDVVAVWVL